MPPLVSITGRSDSGKTTIIEKLIQAFNKRGFRVGTIKHNRHEFEIDYPGKDSWRHKKAGSAVAIISSPKRIGMVKDVDHDHSLEELIPFFPDVDIILAEGYKHENKPKVEIFRADVHSRPINNEDGHLIALVTDSDFYIVGVPRFTTNELDDLRDFLITYFHLITPLKRDDV